MLTYKRYIKRNIQICLWSIFVWDATALLQCFTNHSQQISSNRTISRGSRIVLYLMEKHFLIKICIFSKNMLRAGRPRGPVRDPYIYPCILKHKKNLPLLTPLVFNLQPLTEINTRSKRKKLCFWGVERGRRVRLGNLTATCEPTV
jgi:hypothetical protein